MYRLIFALTTLMLSNSALSEIIDEGQTVYDTDTELRWVKATETRGMSTSDVYSQFGPAGQYRGCNYVTTYNIETLFNNLGLPPDGYCSGYCGTVAPENTANLIAAIKLMGDTLDAQLDATGNSQDVAPDGAGWLKAQYGTGIRFAFLRDGNLVNRTTGAPEFDYNNEQYSKREEFTWIGAPDAGVLFTCPTWPTKPLQSELLDFENIPAGTEAPITHKGFTITGDAKAYDVSGDIDLRTTVCVYCQSNQPYTTGITLERTDGKPFSFFDLKNEGGDLGNCDDGPLSDYRDNKWNRPCTWRGVTTWGETFYRDVSPTADYDEYEVGFGPWLSLQSLTIQATHDNGEFFVDSANPEDVRILLDDVHVGPSIPVELDFDPWNTTDLIDPTNNALITISVATTSIADGEAVDFSGADIDADTLRLGIDQAGVAAATLTQDIDGDGDVDYIYAFRTQDTGIRCIDDQLILSGQTYNSIPFAGAVSVNMHPNCFEPLGSTLAFDLEPADPQNKVYPNDDYILSIELPWARVADGDAVDFNPGDVDYNLRLGPDAATPVGRLSYRNENGEVIYTYRFNMQDTGITCDDTDVELKGLYLDTYWNNGSYVKEPIFPSGAPGFKTSTSLQTEDCNAGCHP